MYTACVYLYHYDESLLSCESTHTSVLCNRLEMNSEMITMKIVEDWGTRAERRWTEGWTIPGENATIIELDVQCIHKHLPTQTVHLRIPCGT